jgi:phage FluMu protein Com
MASSLPVELLPIERPRCPRCRIRMNLTDVLARADGSEKRTFDCPKCAYIDTKVVSDPLKSEAFTRMANSIGPPV